MRIVAGTFRGRMLVAPKGHSTRPTADRTRQALFNVLEHAPWAPPLEGARVLDIFAGSGALGLEALSRGAAWCRFVDRDEAARAAIRANADALGVAGRMRIDRRDAATLAARSDADDAPFDLAFLDPPYGKALAEAALERLAAGGWLATGAIVVVELGAAEELRLQPGTGSADPVPDRARPFELLDQRVWGAARVAFLRAS
ncbi:MAG TPA: 16S rRNA (guanine(966)-N(2))-methyltransferase RsmD [Caulobacteraceae bacterium]|jgi:16S rRNA (guanine966-N2)-methyltransferase|nr:16S rRNA (guanine(966)-N(2))-methyltransferase RsmD [Caulobacteraceae bacterium]